jgi:hypothetical protein
MLAVTYLPYTLAVLLGAKKGDRYLLFLFPLLALAASVTLFEVGRRLRERSTIMGRASAPWITGVFLVLLAGRALRLALVHPLPITWCAPYPGLRCEDVITVGWGEGFRDAARFISEHSRSKRPTILSAYARGALMRPWLDFRRAASGRDAHFVVTYIASDQRGLEQGLLDYAVGEPLHEVRYQGRTYVRIYRGPRHREIEQRRPSRQKLRGASRAP